MEIEKDSVPLITWPTPILVTKSPRPTEESNLVHRSVDCYEPPAILDVNAKPAFKYLR